ncbi:universal stress protein [Paraburkholderia saeva]|uniref:Universal stress protein n=1 Tax=Paraburkholderia saeva TaxID=2777537 RepID=A0A9N8RVS4_9BURK|nr:universal stress protein [Paraburkholderia saeva]CAG4888192.1 hypothetical protein R52603_00601 [Paraburkholderia saeva]CAG4895436.1 hypothetical protein LMG31841_02145 [Paraburkholderia saeva]CAG4897393.1 hypothetical protein R70241_02320 [Paraburkholderia saeva]
MYRHLLVPVDGTDASVEALGQAVEFAQSIGARITFCPISDGRAAPCADAETDTVAQLFDADIASERLARAEAAARAQGVPCSSATSAAVPLSSLSSFAVAARAQGCDLICVTPQQQAPLTGTSAHAASTGGSDGFGIAVLTCAIDPRASVARAIGMLLGGQRAIAVLVHAALHAVRRARASGEPHDAASLREIVVRLGALQGPRHYSMMSALFARLRERTSTVDAELDELERQHRRVAHMRHELAALVAGDQASATAGVELEDALNACAQFTWEHMGREAGVVLPAARRYLHDADWNALSSVFAAPSTGESLRPPA